MTTLCIVTHVAGRGKTSKATTQASPQVLASKVSCRPRYQSHLHLSLKGSIIIGSRELSCVRGRVEIEIREDDGIHDDAENIDFHVPHERRTRGQELEDAPRHYEGRDRHCQLLNYENTWSFFFDLNIISCISNLTLIPPFHE